MRISIMNVAVVGVWYLLLLGTIFMSTIMSMNDLRSLLFNKYAKQSIARSGMLTIMSTRGVNIGHVYLIIIRCGDDDIATGRLAHSMGHDGGCRCGGCVRRKKAEAAGPLSWLLMPSDSVVGLRGMLMKLGFCLQLTAVARRLPRLRLPNSRWASPRSTLPNEDDGDYGIICAYFCGRHGRARARGYYGMQNRE